MQIVICPGVHPPQLTDQFVAAFPNQLAKALVSPVAPDSAYAGWEALPFLLSQLSQNQFNQNQLSQNQLSQNQLSQAGQEQVKQEQAKQEQVKQEQIARQTPILLIGFSAGVVGAAILANLWQNLGGQVVALIALDGWGVPLGGTFPVHRVSHDPFTHWSSALLGAGRANFYASPAVGHLELWRSPQSVQGWGQFNSQSVSGQGTYSPTTAVQFISYWLAHYQTAGMGGCLR